MFDSQPRRYPSRGGARDPPLHRGARDPPLHGGARAPPSRYTSGMRANSVLVIGGGPAGLRAAEVAQAAGAQVVLYDAQRSVGRKFLIAGRGGLNLTHGEPAENFPSRYVDEPERWRDLLRDFGPE